MILSSIVLLGAIGTNEIIIILIIVLLLFGGRKIPELMKGIGKGMREFNNARNNLSSEMEGMIKGTNQPSKSGENTDTTSR